MFRGYNILNLSCLITLLLHYYNCPILALQCYDCTSTFPGSNICLPSCSLTFQANSTCLLTRNIPLEPTGPGSLSAAHISGKPFISDAEEKNFVFGEEAVFLNPSITVGWHWEYGPITYGCDTPGCNNPQYVNSLPNALNARIPNDVLDRLLTGDVDSTCYRCDLCLDENVSGTDMSDCDTVQCPNHACNFVATRSSTTGSSTCDGGWHFSSNCILSKEPAEVDMSLMYYIRSNKTVLYQMATVCLSDNCNNITTFKELKDAITVNPNLDCLINNNFTTISSSPLSTTTGRISTISTTSNRGSTATSNPSSILPTTTISGATTRTTTRVVTTTRAVTTTSRGPISSTTATTTPSGSARLTCLNIKFFILIISFLLFI